MAPTINSSFPVSGGNNTAATWNSTLLETSGNFISSGFTPTAGATVTLNIAAGVAFCGGVRYDVGASTAIMGKSTTNYVFFDPATLDYHIDTDNTSPTNSVRIATVVCDGTGITTITDTRQFVAGCVTVPSTTGAFPQTGTGGASTSVSKLVDLTPYSSGRIMGLWITIYSEGSGIASRGTVLGSATINGTTFANSSVVSVDGTGFNFGGIYFIPRSLLNLTSNETIIVNAVATTGSSTTATIQAVQVAIV